MRIPAVGDMLRWKIDKEVFVVVEETGSVTYPLSTSDPTPIKEYKFNAFNLTGRCIEDIVYNELNSRTWEYLNDP